MGRAVVIDPPTRTDRDDGGDTGEEIGSDDQDDGALFVMDDDDCHKEEEDDDEEGGILNFIANVAIDAVECVGFEATRLTSDVRPRHIANACGGWEEGEGTTTR